MLINGSVVLTEILPVFMKSELLKKAYSEINKKVKNYYQTASTKNYFQTCVIIAMRNSFRQFLLIIYMNIEEEN